MEILFIIVLSVLTLILVFWAIIDIARSRFKDPNKRTIWLIIVIFLPMLGSILYFQLRKKLRTSEKIMFQPKFKTQE